MSEAGAEGRGGRTNVVLIGMMGSGKSCVGRLLADWLGCRLHDIDTTIEYETGRTISSIFAQEGEERFRELEREAIGRAVQDRPSVIATGGGAFEDPRNREALKAGGIVIYLRATPEKLAARVGHGTHRPLLAARDSLGRIQELLRRREPFYLAADCVVDTDALTVEQVVGRIREFLGCGPAS